MARNAFNVLIMPLRNYTHSSTQTRGSYLQ